MSHPALPEVRQLKIKLFLMRDIFLEEHNGGSINAWETLWSFCDNSILKLFNELFFIDLDKERLYVSNDPAK